MADPTYQPKTYRRQGGDEFVVASGGTLTVESGGTINNAGTQTVDNQTLTGYTAQPVAVASTGANAVFEGILEVSSTGSAGVGVYLLDVPVVAGITMDVVCRTSTGGVTLATTAGTIEMNGTGGNTLTFATTTGASVRLIALSTSVIQAIPSSTTAITLA